MPDHRAKLQAALSIAILTAAMFLPLAACGKKPSELDPPPGVANDTFPHVYPDPKTDPKPPPQD